MVQIYKAPKGKKQGTVGATKLTLNIDALEHGGLGVCRSHQPVVFVEGGLPGEQLDVRISEKKPRYWQGIAVKVLSPSAQRIAPFCPHSRECGGCQNQHISQVDLLAHKQNAVGQLLQRQTGMTTLNWQSPILGPAQGYRRKARLAIDAQNKAEVKVGFRAKGSDQVVSISQCPILTEPLQAVLAPLLHLIKQLKGTKQLGHLSVLDADNQLQLCLRITRALPAEDIARLRQFAEENTLRLLLETAPNRFELVCGDNQDACYAPVPELSLSVGPNDFIQVNQSVNQAMVNQALAWLAAVPGERVLDLFCGVGNFSLPLARAGASVIGVEGVEAMVKRASDNASANGLQVDFRCLDLSDSDALSRLPTEVDRVLLDPARAGAQALMPILHKLKPKGILYVSCNPATFTRDAAMLVEKGWQIDKIGLMDMFPQTAHTELMAHFSRPQ